MCMWVEDFFKQLNLNVYISHFQFFFLVWKSLQLTYTWLYFLISFSNEYSAFISNIFSFMIHILFKSHWHWFCDTKNKRHPIIIVLTNSDPFRHKIVTRSKNYKISDRIFGRFFNLTLYLAEWNIDIILINIIIH